MEKKYQVILGQEGDDYDGGAGDTLDEAIGIARRWYDQIKAAHAPTYIYIEKPDGERIDYSKLVPALV